MFEVKPTASTGTIIPAVNHSLARFKFRDDVRPKIHYVMEGITYLPIIAWRVRADGRIEPITIELEPLGGVDGAWAIVCPSGLFVEPGIGSWNSAHDWHMEVLARWQTRQPAVAA